MSHYDLISKLLEDGVLKTKRIIEAFMEIDRADFVKKEYIGEAYGDYPLPTEQGQTISQPSTVAFMLELLQPAEGDRILDVGSGSGWSTALLAQIAGPKGRVWGVIRQRKSCQIRFSSRGNTTSRRCARLTAGGPV